MRRYSKFLILFLLGLNAFSQNARVDGVTQARSGMPAPGALVAVCRQPASFITDPFSNAITDCTPHASICLTSADATCAQPNPVIADGLGNYAFYIVSGTYTFLIGGSGLTTKILPDQSVGTTVTVGGANNEIQINQLGVLGTVPGFTADPSGNVLIPGTLGVTGLITAPAATYTGTVTAQKFATSGGGSWSVSSTFGGSCPAPVGSQNQVCFDASTGKLSCSLNGSSFTVSNCTTPPTYNAAGTAQVGAHFIVDTCTLGTNCSVTLVGSAVFTNSTSYTCYAQDNTAAAATRVAQSSGSAFAITGTGTDVIRYSCAGN